MIFYTTRFLNGFAGTVKVFLIPVIFIDPKYKDDVGLHAHEAIHVRQAWANIFPPIHALRYNLSKSYRLDCEVEAYKVQITKHPKHLPDPTALFAEFISTRYGIDISVDVAERLLRS